MAVTIGIDPHKGSHTAVALDEHETVLGQLRVRSGPDQLVRLTEWAKAWPARTWAVENASGLGYLLSQQLVGAGERVLDVPPKLAARARLLDNGDLNKNDPNDARSVAVAALRAKRLSEVTKEDHAAVMRLWARRRKDLTGSRTRVANRLAFVIIGGDHRYRGVTTAASRGPGKTGFKSALSDRLTEQSEANSYRPMHLPASSSSTSRRRVRLANPKRAFAIVAFMIATSNGRRVYALK